MERDTFLAHLRARLSTPQHPNLPHPLQSLGVVPRVGYTADLTDPVEAFESQSRAIGAIVTRVSDAATVVRSVIAMHNARVVVLSRDPEALDVADVVRDAGAEVVGFADAARADVGITGAAHGIAATGTLVLDAGRAGGRTASLLPPVHLALLRANAIVREAGELFRADGFGESLPSQLVLATGPSRSGDIELVLTVGVHGPREVWIGIIE